MEAKELGQRILNLLSSRSKKQECPTKLAHALKVPKKSLNTELYKLEAAGKVVRVQESPPLWCLASEVSVSTSVVGSRKRRTRSSVSASHSPDDKKIDEALIETVLNHLQQKQTPVKALDIAKAVGLTKAAEVNPTLYHLEKKNIAQRHSGKPPTWSLVQGDMDCNEPPDEEYLDYQATGYSPGTEVCRPELCDDQQGTSGNIPIFQETELFPTNDYDSDNDQKENILTGDGDDINMKTETETEGCRPEFCDDQQETSGNLTTFQDTELFQTYDYNSDNDRKESIVTEDNGDMKMDTESISNDADIGASDEKDVCSEKSGDDGEGSVKTSPKAKPSSFRDIFHLDDPMSDGESDEDQSDKEKSDENSGEDIREVHFKSYVTHTNEPSSPEPGLSIAPPQLQDIANGANMTSEVSQGVDSVNDASIPAETDNNVAPQCSEAANQSRSLGETKSFDSSALCLVDSTVESTKHSAEESKDCLVVLTQLAAFPGLTNFVLRKKTALSDDQLKVVLEECLSMNYVTGSAKLWKITEAGQNLVNSQAGVTEKPSVEPEPIQPPKKKTFISSYGPPPTPMAILESQGHCISAEQPSKSMQNSGVSKSSINSESTQSAYSSVPRPLMSLQLPAAPPVKTTAAGNFSNSLSVGPGSQQSQSVSLRSSQIQRAPSNPAITNNDRNQASSSALWDGFQNDSQQPSHFTKPSAPQGKTVAPTVATTSLNQRELPAFKMKNSDQAPPKPVITQEYLNYPNQKTSHQVLRDIQLRQTRGAPTGDQTMSASRKGPPPTPMELLTKDMKITQISSTKSSKPPNTIYQMSGSVAAVTNTSTFSRPGTGSLLSLNQSMQDFSRPGTGSLLSLNQSRQDFSQPGRGIGTDSGGFRSLPTVTSVGFGTGAIGNSLALNSESFAALNKNPVSALMEYAQSRKLEARIEVIGRRGSAHKPTFEMAAFVGNKKFPSIMCSNKKEGRKEACDIAMRQLTAQGQFQSNTTPTQANPLLAPDNNMTHFDKVAALTHRGFNALVSQISESFAGRKVIAGLVMKRSEADVGVLISLGTGNRCITGEQLSLQGNTINDSHAEVITRRGFIRFLYKQLMEYDPSKHNPLFERSASGKFRVKSNISFHLYISTAPCGDGALFSPRDAESLKAPLDTRIRPPHNPTFSSPVQGLLRTKVEGGEGTIPVEPDFTTQTFDGIQRGERLRTMSCTDKICRWNVLGMQGALLSQFLDPIYLDSLSLGLLFDQGHLSRAVCCRVAYGPTDVDELLPQGYKLNHPWLGRVTVCDPPREIQKTKALSVNWSFGDNGPEVTDGTKGLCYTSIEKGFFSRCSKRNMFTSYKALCEKHGRRDLLQVSHYNEAKQKATEFNIAKKAMLEKFRENKLGKWVSKPVEEEMFGFEET